MLIQAGTPPEKYPGDVRRRLILFCLMGERRSLRLFRVFGRTPFAPTLLTVIIVLYLFTIQENFMSYQIGIDTIHLRPTPRLAHTEYCDSEPLIHAVTGEAGKDWGTQAFNNAWELDLLWVTDDGPVPWAQRGRATDMGHAEFIEGGRGLPPGKAPPPLKPPRKCGTSTRCANMACRIWMSWWLIMRISTAKDRRIIPNQVFTGGYYKTIISGAIEAFGWDMLLEAAANPAKFERTLDSIFRLSLHHFTAWSKYLRSRCSSATMIWYGARGHSCAPALPPK